MTNKYHIMMYIFLTATTLSSCNRQSNFEKGTFGYDLNYLSAKDSVQILEDETGKAQIIVSAKYQAKVFTSTANGLKGNSLGFVNYRALDSEIIDPHMNGYGGENRFWLGPEGGKYSVYFAPGVEQIFDNWHTPKPIDIESWKITANSRNSVSLVKEMSVTNYVGTDLNLRVDRIISLIERPEIESVLDLKLTPQVDAVAYMTDNKIMNLNDFEWTEETGTICIWMLDMFKPGPKAITFIPFNEGDEPEMRKIVTSDYFGEIPDNRLKVKDHIIYLKTDGQYRSKLGLNGKRTKAIAGNYDPDAKRLTVVTFDVDRDAIYLNQEWNPDRDPLQGDAMNAYNDGPLEDGSIMGPFLELESVSPAAFLKPMESLSHKHSVFHFIGEESVLAPLIQKLFGITTAEIQNIF